jgi:hypothetical protein
MPVDERSRHQLYRKLDEVMGREEATTLMELLPPTGWGDVATKQDTHQQIEALRMEMKQDIAGLRRELRGDMESLARQVIMWTSSMVLATAALAFAAGRFV